MPKIKNLILITFSLVVLGLFSGSALAATVQDSSGSGTSNAKSTSKSSSNASYDPCHPEDSGGTPLTADQLQNCKDCQKPGNNNCLQKNPIVRDLNLLVNLLTGSVALVIIGVIIAGGMQYAMAGGNANSIQAAKKRITNALVSLIMFFLIWAFLQWLIPGGI